MAKVALSNGGFTFVDPDDLPLVKAYTWRRGLRGKNVYAVTSLPRVKGSPRKTLYLHRLLHPEWKEIDHKDGDGLNNRRSNLRPCTKRQNQGNTQGNAGTASSFRGVSTAQHNSKNPWRASIVLRSGKRKHLGYYATEEAAARAYNSAALVEFGEFACLNKT